MKSSLYIHIPFCRQKCDYCDFFSIGEKDRKGKCNDISDEYIDSLINEAGFYSKFFNVEEWTSIYLGGGTPGILSESQFAKLFSGLKETSPISEDCEITVEVNPENVTPEKIHLLAECGVNRISMGIQAFDDNVLAKVNRCSSREMIYSALKNLDSFWNGRLSVDFIAGLPGHTFKSFENQFNLLQKFSKIDHVSLYTLTVEENTPLWKKIEDGLIDFSYEKADRMWVKGRNILEKMGFSQYEVSNFARAGFEAKHNSGYWQQKNYVGIGSGATGTVYDFKTKTALRWTDSLSIPAYVNFWSKFTVENRIADLNKIPRNVEELDSDTLKFEFLMMGFRQLCGVNSSEYSARFGESLEERIGAEDGVFSEWKKNHLASSEKTESGIQYSLNRRGILLLNRFLEELL
ncbi:MAG: radical SAM family heme chaperone HemW [Treponema sp.]|nr:radical SAM family heme chaperone HemW [Candidatus Treponema equifaecale]